MEAAGYPADGPAPVALSFETGDAVDDLRCGLSDDTALLLQAKRACGADRHLGATAAQWAAQEPDARPGDRLGLATAYPRGPVRLLGAALDRRRRLIPGPFPPGEQKALAAVRDRLPQGTEEAVSERILDAALVMTVTAESALDPDFRQAASLLEGAVVPAGSGSKAIDVLQQAFRRQAVAGTGSGIDEWLQILAAAGLEVFPDADGPAGPRRRAELDAIMAHRQRLARRDGILEYPLLADYLPPMTHGPLADSFQVSVAGPEARDDRLLHLARRWPRMLLTGLPGTGKSTALQQLAARWAADPGAPVPVLVQLRDLTRRDPLRGSDVTLAVLVEAATDGVPECERAPLRRALEKAAVSGEAALLLDGLDECRERRAVVADGLAVLAADLPAGTGVVLATRSSGLPAARKLGFPEARLAEPAWLQEALRRLLRHAALYLRISRADRDHWVQVREGWLDQARDDHPDLWRIPLLATLLTLLAARRDTGALPASRALLLAEAVQDTVHRWELSRPAKTVAVGHPQLRPELLLDGYGEIAHALSGTGRTPAEEVRRAVAAMLADRWGLPPGEAGAQASEVMEFWDEGTGVFVSSPGTGDIEPRSRVFAEIGDAMWATRQEHDTQRAWVMTAITDNDRREPALLAAGLSAEIAGALLQSASHEPDQAARSRALLWAADAVVGGAKSDAESLNTLLSGLAGAARSAAARPAQPDAGREPSSSSAPTQAKQARRAGPGWAYVLRIATLPLPGDLRAGRQDLLTTLMRTDDETVITVALAALADAKTDFRGELDPAENLDVRRLLAVPIPDRGPLSSRQVSRKYVVSSGGSGRLLPGHHQAAEEAIRHISQLGPQASERIYQIARCGTTGGYWRVCERLTALGFQDPEPMNLSSAIGAFHRRITDVWQGWDIFLEAAASVAPARPLTAAERWRFPDVAALSDILDANDATLDGVDAAFAADKALLPGWIRAAAHAADLDLPALAGQAAAALAAWHAGDGEVINVMFAPPPRPRIDRVCHDDDDAGVLIDALGASSEWLASVACSLLLPARDPAIANQIAGRLSQMPANRRRDATIVLLANDDDAASLAEGLFCADDPPTRAGVAAASVVLGRSDTDRPWTAFRARAQADDDMTVRFEISQDQATAERAAYWSCSDCGRINTMSSLDCTFCEHGTRPGDHWQPSAAGNPSA